MSVFDRIDRQIDNMNMMLRIFGIDPSGLARLRIGNNWFRVSMRTCQSCPNGEICRLWLATAPDQVDRVPEFCPNALSFESVKVWMSSNLRLN
jgi:hypothetical protein